MVRVSVAASFPPFGKGRGGVPKSGALDWNASSEGLLKTHNLTHIGGFFDGKALRSE